MKITGFRQYQSESRKTWGVILMDHPIVYPTLGLVNEAGVVPDPNLHRIRFMLEDVAEVKITKLFSRLERGKIRGDGDNR